MKVSVYREPWNASISIMFWEERGGKYYAAKPVSLDFAEAPEGIAPLGPTLRIHGMFANDFLKAMAEALDEHGVKTDNDARIAGTLEATRFHLSDLRKLLKIDK